MEIKTILVPTDFSEHAEYAFTWALGMAADWGAKIVLFHASPLFSHLAYPESMYLVDLNQTPQDSYTTVTSSAASTRRSSVGLNAQSLVNQAPRGLQPPSQPEPGA